MIEYPSDWPNLEIVSGNDQIAWSRGDSNYIGIAGGKVGNTNFGMNEQWVEQLGTNWVKPGSGLIIKAEEVPGLDFPGLDLQLFKRYHYDALSPYPLEGNKMTAPAKEGEYIFVLSVDWGQGDNMITYWFKLEVVS